MANHTEVRKCLIKACIGNDKDWTARQIAERLGSTERHVLKVCSRNQWRMPPEDGRRGDGTWHTQPKKAARQ